ncbi:hypothetical protein ACU4GG_08475 [Streptomyces nojiriensis]
MVALWRSPGIVCMQVDEGNSWSRGCPSIRARAPARTVWDWSTGSSFFVWTASRTWSEPSFDVHVDSAMTSYTSRKPVNLD